MKLIDQMKIIQANAFVFYLTTHFYHWNVEGPNFPEYHKLFEMIYQDVWESIDDIAEKIRALNEYALGTMDRITELSQIKTDQTVPQAKAMVTRLVSANEIMIKSLREGIDVAGKEKEYGVQNFLQDRLDRHQKWQWQLKATAK